jgi:hypothetical protein
MGADIIHPSGTKIEIGKKEFFISKMAPKDIG